MTNEFKNRQFSGENNENPENKQNIKSFYSSAEWYKTLDASEQEEIDEKIKKIEQELSEDKLREKGKDYWQCFAEREFYLVKIDKIINNSAFSDSDRLTKLLILDDDIDEKWDIFKSHNINPSVVFSKIYQAFVDLLGKDNTSEFFAKRATDRAYESDPF